MAKGSSVDDLVYYALVAGVGYVGYTTALNGQLGPDAQKLAENVRNWFRGLTNGNGGGGSNPDPELQATMALWQHARCGDGLDPNDWQAFRDYEAQRGYTTPQYAPAGWGYNCDGGSYY